VDWKAGINTDPASGPLIPGGDSLATQEEGNHKTKRRKNLAKKTKKE